MTIYQVTVHVPRELSSDWSQWMKDVHIPDVLKTGIWLEARMHRITEPRDDDAETYCIRYMCNAPADYERYRHEFAADLQALHRERYGARVRAERTVMNELHHILP